MQAMEEWLERNAPFEHWNLELEWLEKNVQFEEIQAMEFMIRERNVLCTEQWKQWSND